MRSYHRPGAYKHAYAHLLGINSKDMLYMSSKLCYSKTHNEIMLTNELSWWLHHEDKQKTEKVTIILKDKIQEINVW